MMIINNSFSAKPYPINAVSIEGLTVCYDDKIILDNIHTVFESGKITGIIGPNGAGKSTLLKSMLGLVKTQKGEVLMGEEPIGRKSSCIAYMEQRSALDLSFPIHVLDTVILGTYPGLRLMKRPGRREKERALQALGTVKMDAYADRQIGELSGGQLQRVLMARALAQQAEVFLLDEPFTGIDAVSEEMIMRILYDLRNEGKTIGIVHHDLNKASEYFDHILILNKTVVAKGSVKQCFTQNNLIRAYGGSSCAAGLKGGMAS